MSNTFPAFIELIIWVCPLFYISLIDFQMLNQPCILGIFVFIATRDTNLDFLVISLSGFGVRVIQTSKDELESVLFCFLGRVYERLVFIL